MLWSCLYLILRQLLQLVVLLGRAERSKAPGSHARAHGFGAAN